MWRYGDIRTIPDIVRYWGARTPDKVALIDGAASRTYAELDRRSSAIANRLIERGVKPGSPVGFIGKNSLDFFEVWFAAGKAGCPVVPFNWRCPENELLQIVDDAQAGVIFVSQELEAVMKAVRARSQHAPELVVFDPAGLDGDRLTAWMGTTFADPRTAVTASSLALLTYTSGTTGRPKAAVFTQEAFDHSFLVWSLEPNMSCREDDRMLMLMPNFHLGGSWVCLEPLYAGATLSVLPQFDPAGVIEVVKRDRCTIIPLVPTAIQALLASPAYAPEHFASVRSIYYFGSPISADLMRRAKEGFRCELYQLYGATEMWIATILRPEAIPGHEARLAACGTALPLLAIRIEDRDGKDVPPGTVGEVVVRTPAMFAGYWNQPEATARVLVDGWYRTGDLGRRDADGFYYLVDRVKDMVITGGENVYSVEVEQALLKHPAVALAAVIGVPDDRWGEKVTAFVVLAAGASADEPELQAHCRAHIAGYKVPKAVHVESALPMTPSGKIQKPALRERMRAAAR
jgi:acyl-CoA synthetase (AMP-forming)/AMP-acid ligase II